MSERKLCVCGCGKRVSKKYNKYIHGHNNNRKKKEIFQTKPQTYCLCGCGELTMPGNIYIHGHYSKGKRHYTFKEKVYYIICPVCGKARKITLSMIKNIQKRSFPFCCSYKCSCNMRFINKDFGDAQDIFLFCKNCGKVLRMSPNIVLEKIMNKKYGFYCSSFCFHKVFKGKNHPCFGKSSWNKDLTKETDKRVKSISNAMYKRMKNVDMSGENNPYYGKKHTKEILEKMSGENNPSYGKTLEEIHGKNCDCPWCKCKRKEILPQDIGAKNNPSNFEKDVFKKIDNLCPNQWIHNTNWKKRFLYNYNGEKKFKYPDIYHKRRKILIEVNGIYWHTRYLDMPKEENENLIKNIYSKYDYDTIIIWEDDYRNNKNKDKFLKEKIGEYL